jgi:hypothetical protein
MEKFISVPVTGQPNQLISATNVSLVSAGTGATNNTATATTTVITYNTGRAVTLTHAAQAAYDMRTAIQDALANALATSWTNVAYVAQVPRAISAVTIV